jgi:methyltransferase
MVDLGWLVALVWGTVVVQRVTELRLARRNTIWAREQGAREFGARHYVLFFVLHSAWLFAWPLEALWLGGKLAAWWWVWGAALVLAEGLRYWSIATLGRRWNTRILVLPGRPRIGSGPYKWASHPNYLAVMLELAAVPLVFGAWRTAAVVSVLNLALLGLVRVPAEVRAMRWAQRAQPGD